MGSKPTFSRLWPVTLEAKARQVALKDNSMPQREKVSKENMTIL